MLEVFFMLTKSRLSSEYLLEYYKELEDNYNVVLEVLSNEKIKFNNNSLTVDC